MIQAAPGLYTDPAVYDILHARGTAAEVDGLERMAARVRSGRARQTWLEPACGTARYLRLAARRGRRTVGFDLSPVMIATPTARIATYRKVCMGAPPQRLV